jgi:hypothetical protein
MSLNLFLFVLFGCGTFASGACWLLMRLSYIRKHPGAGIFPKTWRETFKTVAEAKPSHKRGYYFSLALCLIIWTYFMLLTEDQRYV